MMTALPFPTEFSFTKEEQREVAGDREMHHFTRRVARRLFEARHPVYIASAHAIYQGPSIQMVQIDVICGSGRYSRQPQQ